MKIALIGAGSFVFGSSMLNQTLREHRLNDVEIALMDIDAEVVELMAGVGRRMAREEGLNALISTHTTFETALDGADFVIYTVAPQIHKRFAMDCEIIDLYTPGHLPSEFGGVAGISYSLRQIALLEKLTAAMQKHCPQAWLLDVANPLPRVAQAAHEAGIKTVGFCAVAVSGYAMLWQLFTGETLAYPYTAAREKWDVVSAGLNHFAWVLEFRDKATGAELLPELRQRLADGATSGNPVSERLARETGYLLVPHDDHTRDFLPPSPDTNPCREAGHGSPEERKQRLTLLKEIGEGRASYDALLKRFSWERPLDLIAAMTQGRPAEFHSLNLLNTGQIANLPRHVFVETPATASAEGAVPQNVMLPESVLPYCERTALVTNTIVCAARERSRALVYEAAELDPTILDKAAGRAALDACLLAHADLLPEYG